MWKIVHMLVRRINALAVALTLSLSAPTSVMAYDELFYSGNDIIYYNPEATDACQEVGPATSSADLSGVPEPWRSLISSASSKYKDVDARLVAATLFVENRGWPDYNKNWATSSAGAQGPWQFIPSTWSLMGKDGNNDGKRDPNEPKDAVLAAFEHQRGSAGKPLIKGFTGDLESGLSLRFSRSHDNLLGFMAGYNGSGAPDNTPLNKFPRNENSDYVKMAYYAIGSGFKQTWDTTTGKPKSFNAKGTVNASGSVEATEACGSGSSDVAYVNTDGFAFPIGLPKNKITFGNNQKFPCTTKSCHHDGTPAFDLFANIGTPVYAIEDGSAANVKDNYFGNRGCFSIQYKGKSGWYYWYGHIKSPTITPNKPVKAGDKIAVVGEARCAKDTPPHLHIDRGDPKGHTAGEDAHRSTTINDLLNSLYKEIPG